MEQFDESLDGGFVDAENCDTSCSPLCREGNENLTTEPQAMSLDQPELAGEKEVLEVLEELSMSDDDEISPAKFLTPPTRIKYSQSELEALRDVPGSRIRPSALKPEFVDNDGYWNPLQWHASITNDSNSRRSGSSGDSPSRKVNYTKRLNLSVRVPVLTPHRESFEVGCQAKASGKLESQSNKENSSNDVRTSSARRRSLRDNAIDSFGDDGMKRNVPRLQSSRAEPKSAEPVRTFCAVHYPRTHDNLMDSDYNNNQNLRNSRAPMPLSNVKPLLVSDSATLSNDFNDEKRRYFARNASNSCTTDDVFPPQNNPSKGHHDSLKKSAVPENHSVEGRCDVSGEPEWMSAADYADSEFDFGNLESFRQEYNEQYGETKNIKKKPANSFDVNTFFKSESAKNLQNEVQFDNNNGSTRQSRIAHLFNRQGDNIDSRDKPRGHSTKNQVFEVSDLEAHHYPTQKSDEQHISNACDKTDLKAFNNFISKFNVSKNVSTPVLRTANTANALFENTQNSAHGLPPVQLLNAAVNERLAQENKDPLSRSRLAPYFNSQGNVQGMTSNASNEPFKLNYFQGDKGFNQMFSQENLQNARQAQDEARRIVALQQLQQANDQSPFSKQLLMQFQAAQVRMLAARQNQNNAFANQQLGNLASRKLPPLDNNECLQKLLANSNRGTPMMNNRNINSMPSGMPMTNLQSRDALLKAHVLNTARNQALMRNPQLQTLATAGILRNNSMNSLNPNALMCHNPIGNVAQNIQAQSQLSSDIIKQNIIAAALQQTNVRSAFSKGENL